MMMRWVAITVVMALNTVAQPSWKRPGACITAQGTLCRTLIYESSGWANSSWGFHNVDRYVDRMIEAVRSDGSALLRVTHRRYKHYLIPSERSDRTRVVLPAKTQTYEIDHSRKEVRDLGGVWRFSEHWTDDADCQKRAANAGENWRKTGEQPVVAGLRSVEYVYETPDHRVVQRVAFAPAIGCTAVSFTLSRRTANGLQLSEDRLNLIAATLGEPDVALFAAPAEFRLVGVDWTWPYISMDAFPGNITTTSFSRPVP